MTEKCCTQWMHSESKQMVKLSTDTADVLAVFLVTYYTKITQK